MLSLVLVAEKVLISRRGSERKSPCPPGQPVPQICASLKYGEKLFKNSREESLNEEGWGKKYIPCHSSWSWTGNTHRLCFLLGSPGPHIALLLTWPGGPFPWGVWTSGHQFLVPGHCTCPFTINIGQRAYQEMPQWTSWLQIPSCSPGWQQLYLLFIVMVNHPCKVGALPARQQPWFSRTLTVFCFSRWETVSGSTEPRVAGTGITTSLGGSLGGTISRKLEACAE